MIKVPKVFPLKNLTLFVPLHLHQTTKKSVSRKKTHEPLSPPLDSKSQCAALMLPLGLLCGFAEACLLYHIQGFVNDVFSSDGYNESVEGAPVLRYHRS